MGHMFQGSISQKPISGGYISDYSDPKTKNSDHSDTVGDHEKTMKKKKKTEEQERERERKKERKR